MASKADQNTVLVTMIAVMASAVLFFWGTGLHPRWTLTWIAPLPVLLIAPRLSGKAAFGWSTLAWSLGGLNMWHYFAAVAGPQGSAAGGILPLLVPLFFTLGVGCVFALSVLLWRYFVRRGEPGKAALALPAAWVAYEYILSLSWPHGTWGSLAYTQVDVLLLVQLASLTGVWGMSFFLLLPAATLAALLASPATGRQKRTTALGFAIACAAVVGYGWWRLHWAPQGASWVMVGLIATDTRENLFSQSPEQTPRLMQDYLDQARSLAAEGAQVIVLPEKLGVVIDPRLTLDLDGTFRRAAQETGSEIVVGVIRRTPTARLNEARVYPGTGQAPLLYEKQHMLPAFESGFAPGTRRLSFDQQSGKWGVEICKDMDFPRLSRDYGADRVGLMLVPAWDFGEDGWLHGRMAVLRGVESGFSIARAPKQGLLTVSDDRGRILAEKNSSAARFAALVARVPVRNDVTVYRVLGDWFAWLDLVLLAWLLAEVVRGRDTLSRD